MRKELLDKPVLAVYDISGIQQYIFKTNKVREIIGASAIVATIFEDSLKHILPEINLSSNECILEWNKKGDDDLYLPLVFEKDNNIKIEVIYMGGGNTYILYRTGDLCLNVNKKLSKKFLKDTYSLSLAIAVIEYTQNYEKDFANVMQELDKIKSNIPLVKLTGNFPITKQEVSTGYPLSQYVYGYDTNYVSLEQKAKLDKFNEIKHTINDEKIFDNMVTEQGSESLLAIVHIDGNNMGEKFNNALKNKTNYSEASLVSRNLSDKINSSFKKAYKKTEKVLTEWVKNDKCEFKNKFINNDYKKYIRLIINSGDDLTFVCNAKLAISLCEIFLNNLTLDRDGFSACAGIAIINSHFPFSEGYKVAEACCKSAKNKAKSLAIDSQSTDSFIDFQICKHISLSNSLKKHREKNYLLSDGTYLFTRPYFVCSRNKLDKNYEFCNLKNFKMYHKYFSNTSFPKNWAKNLRNTYSDGKIAVETLKSKMDSRQVKLPEKELYINDVYNKVCVAKYFDVLEMLELYIDIEGE